MDPAAIRRVRRVLSGVGAAVVYGAALIASHEAVYGQRPQGAVVPEAITVGDVFRAAIRVELPQGAQLIAPDTLAVPADVESAGRREMVVDTTPSGARVATLTWPLAAWRPGAYALPDVTVRIATDGGAQQLTVSLPSFEVRSVLPADTAGLDPRAAKDVLGANRVWWPILLGLLIAALLAVGLYVWWKRRQPAPPVDVPVAAVPARTLALDQLRELSQAGLLERGEVKEYYGRLTAVLRQYAAVVNHRWGADLTTSELGGRLRRDLPASDALDLLRILGAADLVKFARARPTVEGARADLASAENWVSRVGRVPVPGDHEMEAA